MALAPGLTIRTLVRPGGRLTTVITRRPRRVVPKSGTPSVVRRVDQPLTKTEPRRADLVPTVGNRGARSEFSPPIVRAMAALGGRARAAGQGDVLLDGRRAPLVRVVAEANRCLAAAGRSAIVYPGVHGARG